MAIGTGSAASPSRAASDRGALKHLEGDFEGAAAAYEEALEADPNNASAMNNLGLLRAQQGRFDEAEALYRRAIELNPDASMAKANLGNLRALRGDLEGAIRLLREAVSSDPANVLAWDNLGRVLLKAEFPGEAEAAWREAIAAVESVDGESAEALSLLYTGLGAAVAAQGRRDEAVRILQQAAALDPGSVEAWTQLGVALFLRKDFGSAAAALRRALAVDPDSARARRHLGIVHLATGDRAGARRELERAHRCDPEDVRVRTDLAALDLSEDRPKEALNWIDGIEAAGEDWDRIRFFRGVALDRLGRRDEALEILCPLSEQVTGKYAVEARRYLATLDRGGPGRREAFS